MNRLKQGLIVFTILTLGLIQTSQALTMQEILSGQQGQVLGASTPVRIGATQSSSYGKTLTFTAASGVAQGHTVVVSAVTTGVDPTGSGWASCTDSAGNSYSRDASVYSAAGAIICSAYVSNAIPNNGTITISFSSNAGLSGAAYDLTPTTSAGRINVFGTATNGYGGSMSVSASGAVSASSIVIGIFATGASSSSFNNCTGLDTNVANGQGLNLSTCWSEVMSGTPSFAMNLASATSGVSLLVGYTESAGTPPPADTTAPTIPTNLSASAVSSSSINLSWSASTDAVGVTGYKIYRSGSLLATSNSTATTYSDTGLSASTSYSYTVAAYDAVGNTSSQSSSASATTQAAPVSDTTAPTVPTGLSASAVSSSSINLSWSASTDAVGVVGYKIYRNGSLLTTTNSQLTTYSDTGLSASTSYSYTVAAYDAAGNTSAQSTSASATTQAQASGNCSAANIRCVGSGQEYATISAAAAATVAGDTVVVYPGTYNESINITRSGTSGAKITYQGFLPGSSCPSTTYSDINSRGFRPSPTVIMNGFTVSASYIRIDCFNTNGKGVLDITQPNIHDVESVNNYSAAGAGGSVGVSLNDQLTLATSAQNIYVGYNFISGGGYGVLQKCRNCKYEYNEFYQMNPGTSGADGDYARIFGNDITFYKNYMHGNDRNLCGGTDCHIDCFQTFAYTTDFPAYNITIDSNVCFNASEGVIATNVNEFNVFHDWVIKNNLIAHAPLNYYGEQCMIISSIKNVQVYNNTCTDAGVTTYAGTTTATHKNNIHERVGTYLAYRSIDSAAVTSSNNLLYDTGYSYTSSGDVVNKSPLFVNAAADNYQLQSNSPAINAGANVGLAVDIIGASRPQGAGYDIGAYEYASGGGSSPTPVPGDLNLDHVVNSLDFSLLNSKWNQNYPSYDLNGDGFINSFDYAVLKNNWGKTW